MSIQSPPAAVFPRAVPPSPFLRRWRWWLLILAIGAIATVGVGIVMSHTATGNSVSRERAGDRKAGATSSRTAGEGVVCFGFVDLQHGVTALYPLQPGRVAEVLVQEGDTVSAGAPLIRLEDGVARSRVTEAQAAVEVAELGLARARKLPEQHRSRMVQQQDALEVIRRRIASARLLLGRKQKLVDQKLMDASESGIAENQIQELEAQERVEEKRLADLKQEDPRDDERRADKEMAIARARLDQARLALDDCTLKAPRRGTVLRLQVGPGDVLAGQAKQPAVLFAADGPQVIRAEVEQEFADRVTATQSVLVEDEANSDAVWKGRVQRVSNWFTQRRSTAQEPLEFNDVRMLECLITLDPGQPPLRIGQRVRVLIGTERTR
jgi:HlyD family secretion protein